MQNPNNINEEELQIADAVGLPRDLATAFKTKIGGHLQKYDTGNLQGISVKDRIKNYLPDSVMDFQKEVGKSATVFMAWDGAMRDYVVVLFPGTVPSHLLYELHYRGNNKKDTPPDAPQYRFSKGLSGEYLISSPYKLPFEFDSPQMRQMFESWFDKYGCRYFGCGYHKVYLTSPPDPTVHKELIQDAEAARMSVFEHGDNDAVEYIILEADRFY